MVAARRNPRKADHPCLNPFPELAFERNIMHYRTHCVRDVSITFCREESLGQKICMWGSPDGESQGCTKHQQLELNGRRRGTGR